MRELKPVKPLLTLAEFQHLYGVGRTRLYDLLNAGSIDAVKSGIKTMIVGESAERWAKSLPKFVPGASKTNFNK